MTDSTFVTPEEAATEEATVVDVEATDTPEAAPASDAVGEIDAVATPEAVPGNTSEDSEDDEDSDEDDADDEKSEGDDSESDGGTSDETSDQTGAKAGAGDEGEPAASRLEVEGDIAADYLEELLDIADLDGDIDTFVEGGRAQVSIVTEGDQLVGKNGEVLDALQELARLVVMTETDHRSRLMLDIAGHRDRRRSELTIVAKDAIAEVKQSGEAARLAPMNPFERKIVHDLVAEAGLVSESEGVEPQRRVVILP